MLHVFQYVSVPSPRMFQALPLAQVVRSARRFGSWRRGAESCDCFKRVDLVSQCQPNLTKTGKRIDWSPSQSSVSFKLLCAPCFPEEIHVQSC